VGGSLERSKLPKKKKNRKRKKEGRPRNGSNSTLLFSSQFFQKHLKIAHPNVRTLFIIFFFKEI
jgi:hypothetical protein